MIFCISGLFCVLFNNNTILISILKKKFIAHILFYFLYNLVISKNLVVDDLIKNTVCEVCHSPCTGIHFGIMSCEACKGFFRRSNMNNQVENYKCKKSQNCVIDSSSRNCRYCRYQKCLSVGMSSQCNSTFAYLKPYF